MNRPDTEFHVPEDFGIIASYAFVYSQHLETLTMSSNVSEIHSFAFRQSSIPHIILSENLHPLHDSAFREVTSLETLTFTRVIDADSTYTTAFTLTGYDDGNFTIYVPSESYVYYKELASFEAFVNYIKPFDYVLFKKSLYLFIIM